MRFARLPMEERPTPPAPRTDDRLAALAGTALWTVSLAVVLLDRGSLLADDRGWWVWCCVAGVLLGLVGLLHLQRREIASRTAARRARRAARQAALDAAPRGPAGSGLAGGATGSTTGGTTGDTTAGTARRTAP